MGMSNQRRGMRPFQMGSGGLVPRGGRRDPGMFQNTGAGSANLGPRLDAMLGGGGQMPSPFGMGSQGGFSGAVQGAMQGIGPGGLQAGPATQTVMGPGGPMQVQPGMYPNAQPDPTMRAQRPILPQPVQEPMGPGDQGPSQYNNQWASDFFARLFGQRP